MANLALDDCDGPPTSIPYGDNNEANEYSTVDGVTVLYDAAGNVYEDEDDYRFFYDFENRLIRIEKLYSGGFGLLSIGGGGPGGTWTAVAIHEYDALGRRIQTITSNGLFDPDRGRAGGFVFARMRWT